MTFMTANAKNLRKSHCVSVLDIGSSKIVCLIARLRPGDGASTLPGRSHHVELLGFGIHQSYGIKAGNVVDVGAAEQAIRLAVDAAEKQAGLIVESVLVSLSAGRPESCRLRAQIPLSLEAVTHRDLRRVLAAASQRAFELDRPIIHSLPVSYYLDGEDGIDDPVGLFGTTLGVDLHVATVGPGTLRNIEHCINRAHLTVENFVLTPVASALAVMVGDEAQLGATCIDIGAGTTTIAAFRDGKFVYGGFIPIGAHHVTLDIARGLSIVVDEAERLKVMYGAPWHEGDEDGLLISMPPRDEGEAVRSRALPAQYPRTLLSRIIRARLDEIFELAKAQIARSGLMQDVGGKIILTGGGAQMTGLAELARLSFGPRVRLGRPLGVSGLPDMARGSAFSSAVGLLIYPQLTGFNLLKGQPTLLPEAKAGSFSRVGRWLRESF